MNRKKIIVILSVVSLIVIASSLMLWKGSSEETPNEELTQAEIKDLVKTVIASGKIQPRIEVNIKPQISGVIDKIFVEEGQIVKKGQKIAEIRIVSSPSTLLDARSRVQTAKIRMENAYKELKKQRQVFNGKIDIAEAKANYDNAKINLSRAKDMYKDGLISKQQYEDVQLNYDKAIAMYETSKLSSDFNVTNQQSNYNIAKEEYQNALSNLSLLQTSANTKNKSVSNEILSTVDGTILQLPLKVGASVIERNTMSEGSTIATIADMNSLMFEGKVDEVEVGNISENMDIDITVGALNKTKLKGKVEKIAPKGEEIDGSTKFVIKASIVNDPKIKLRAGYSANGDIIIDSRKKVLTINERDVIFNALGDSTWVEVSTDKDKYEKKYVKLGLSDGILVEIVSGIDAKTKIKKQINQ